MALATALVAGCAAPAAVERAPDGAIRPAVVDVDPEPAGLGEAPVLVGTVSWIGDPERIIDYRAFVADDGRVCLEKTPAETGRDCFARGEGGGGSHGGQDPEWCAHLALPEETARAVIETVDGTRMEMTRLLAPATGVNVFGACWIGRDTRWLEYHDAEGRLVRRHRF